MTFAKNKSFNHTQNGMVAIQHIFGEAQIKILGKTSILF